jgi:hypothetical protein
MSEIELSFPKSMPGAVVGFVIAGAPMFTVILYSP